MKNPLHYKKERFTDRHNTTVEYKVMYIAHKEMEIADLLKEEGLRDLEEFCEDNRGRFVLFNNNIRFIASTKKQNEKLNYVTGDWIDVNDNIIEKNIKAIKYKYMIHFFSKKKKRNIRIRAGNFNIRRII